jgi:hypothetical protein
LMANESLNQSSVEERIRELMSDASPEVRQIVGETLRIERDKLHMKLPRNVVEELVDAIEMAVD